MTKDDLVQRWYRAFSGWATEAERCGDKMVTRGFTVEQLHSIASALAAAPPETVRYLETCQRQLAAIDAVIGFPDGSGRGRVELLQQHAAAQSADLVALVREYQEAVRNVTVTDDVSAGEARIKQARRALLDYPLPADPSLYDPSFGDEEVCACGHHYYRHFDSYDEMAPVGCKYCECMTFTPQEPPR